MSKEVKKYQGGGYAAPLGQAPLGVIRPPDTGISVPNPMDVTNFYRMQQGIQQNLGLVQGQQRIMQTQQQLDLQNYELLLKETDQILGMTGSAFDITNAKHESSKQGSANSMGGMFGFLDPTKPEHARIIDKYYNDYQALQAANMKLGQGYLSSSTRDPSQRLEIAHQIRRGMDDFKRKMMGDKEFVEQNNAAMAYDAYMQSVAKKREEGLAIDVEEFDRVTKMYEDYANGTSTTVTDANGNVVTMKAKPPKFTDFDPSRAVYDPKEAFVGIAETAKILSQGEEQTGWEILPDGQRVEKKFVVKPDEATLTQRLVDIYKDNPNAIKLYNNTVKGKVHPEGHPKAGQEITFPEWIEAQVKFYAQPQPNSGEEIVTDYGTTVVKPFESAATKAAAKRVGTNDDGNWFDTSTDAGREKNDIAESVYDQGYNVQPKDKYAVGLVAGDPERYGIVYEEVEDEEGNVSPEANVYVYEVDEKGKRKYEDGKPLLAQTTPVHTFDRRPANVNLNRDSSSSSSYEAPSPKDDVGSRNNNPLNLRPTSSEREQGVPTGSGGFRKFDTLEEGFEAAKRDIKSKVIGNSSAMPNSEYMKSKYTPQQLKNYEEVATIEDLINVWSPRFKYGGDNSDAVVDNYVKTVAELSGFPAGTRLRDLGDEDIEKITLAMMRVESPDSYDRLVGERSKKRVIDPLTGEEIKVSRSAMKTSEANLTGTPAGTSQVPSYMR